MEVLKRNKATTTKSETRINNDSYCMSSVYTESTDDNSDDDDSYDSFVESINDSIDEVEYDDFAEDETFGDEVLRRFVDCALCLVPTTVRKKLAETSTEREVRCDEDSLEANEIPQDAKQSSTKSQRSKEQVNRLKGAKMHSKERQDDELIDAITGMLPQCQDITADYVNNELHMLVKKKLWKALSQKLFLLNNKHASALQLTEKQHLEMMIRQLDEHGRTPLSLACGKSQAPEVIIKLLLHAYPGGASVEDKNQNLPLHHFCHSYGPQTDQVSDYPKETQDEVMKLKMIHSAFSDSPEETQDGVMILKMIHSAHPSGIEHVNAYGNTPLHVYIEHQFAISVTQRSFCVARALLQLNPGAASVTNRSGSLPMHYMGKKILKVTFRPEAVTQPNSKALGRSFINELHKACPNAVMIYNNFGATPFLIAVIYNASIDIWQELLIKYPEAAKLKNHRGISPITAFWNMFVSLNAKKKYLHFSEQQARAEGKVIVKNRLLMSKITCLQDLRLNSPIRLIDFWLKMELMIRAACFGTTSATPVKLPSGETWSPLHSICSIEECPCDVLKFALQMYKEEATKVDSRGNLPLHVLLSNVRQDATTRQAENTKAMIEYLIDASPTTVSHRTLKGQKPLHIALCYAITWNTGIRSLVDANKVTVRIRDPATRLFPFMQAAVAQPDLKCSTDDETEESGLQNLESFNTIFQLLIIYPGLAHSKPSREKTLFEKGAEVMRLQRKREQDKDMLTKKKNCKHCHVGVI